MSEAAFHQTRMGQNFFDKTMPELVRELDRLNNLLELVIKEARDRRRPRQSTDAADDD